jgi:hypothetical protein
MVFRCVLFGLSALVLNLFSSGRAAEWAVRGSDIIGVDLFGITHTPTGFIAVGPGGTVAKSATGREWIVEHVHPHDFFLGGMHGNGKYVLAGHHIRAGVIWVSRNGSHWQRVAGDLDGPITRVAYGNGRFVGVGGGRWGGMGISATSQDGITWESQVHSYPISTLSEVKFVEDRFLAAGWFGVFASTDGLNWTDTGAGRILAVGIAVRGSTVLVAERWGGVKYSNDGGRSWEDVRAGGPNPELMSVGAGPDLFVAVGDNGRISTSPDGRVWSDQDSGIKTLLEDVSYGDEAWVIVGIGGAILRSTDGMKWETISAPLPNLSDVTFGADRFVAVGPDAILHSDDGHLWETLDGPGANSVAYGKELFVAVGKDFKVSTDGVTWTSGAAIPRLPLSKVLFAGDQFVAVGGVDALNFSESVAYRSEDGVNWSPVPVNSTGNLDSLGFVDGSFIAHSSVWNVTTLIGDGPMPPVPHRIESGGLAGGHAGLLAIQPGGQVWLDGVVSTQPPHPPVSAAAYAEGRYFAFGEAFTLGRSRVWVSEDGLNWRDVSPLTNRQFRAAAVGHGQVVIVGDRSIYVRSLEAGLIDSAPLTINAEASGVKLSWPSKRGHRYRLENSTTLNSWQPVLDGTTSQPQEWLGTGDGLTWEAPHEVPRNFFRLQIRAE